MRLKPSRRHRQLTVVLPLEPRLMFAVDPSTLASQETVLSAIPNVLAEVSSPASQSVTLSTYIQDPNVPGTIATIQTSKGNIVVALTDEATPISVANFLSYVNSGAYDSTVYHRTVNFAQTTAAQEANPDAGEVGGSMAHPADVVQGGGYTVVGSGLVHIATSAPILNDETGTGALSNVAGTIAFGNTGAANSATSEFFFNNTDNSSSFDGRYTVFGHVLSGMNVISTIAELPTSDQISATISGQTSKLPDVPIAGLTAAQIADNVPIGTSNLVYTYGITASPGTTYTATSSDPSLVVPTVKDGVLSFTYGASKTGTAIISVTATNNYDGTTANTSFAVTVPPATSTTTGPVAAAADALTAVAASTDSTGKTVTTPANLYPLANDTDATAALNPTTLYVVTAPTHGTATIGSTGQIVYTATTPGYTGSDTFTYAVSDADGYASAATTVTVNVIAAPESITIGTGSKVKSLAFTQPDGTKGRLSLSGGSAVVTFSAGAVTTSTAGGVETVTGAGATISDVVVTNNKNANPVVTISTIGKGTVTLGGLSDSAGLGQLIAPTTDLTGALAVSGLQRLVLGAADEASIAISGNGSTVATIGTATNSSLSAGSLTSLTSKAWVVNDGGSHVVSADVIGTLTVPGGFADDLEVTSTSGYGLTTATVGTASGEWLVGGAIRKATLTKPTSGWSLQDDSVIQNLTIAGDLASDVTAAIIEDMTVTGAMDKAVLQTDALFNSATVQLVKLSVAGAITDSTIATVGNIGKITAKSMTASQIYAGANSTIIGDDALPTSASDLSYEATITSVTLTAGKGTFASSEIAAYTINGVSLGTVTASNGGTGFGLSAHVLASVRATLDPGGSLVLTKAQTKSAAVLSAYLTKQKKSLSDFVIDLY
jgi:peptidyl-prolyl cis-trans isomerase A (cyclophilin A)